MKRLKRKLVLAFIVMLFAFVSTVGVTYAWWNMLTHTESEQVELGEGDTIIVSETLAGTGILIPVGQTPTGSEVTEVIFTYDVSINIEALEAGTTTLSVSAENVLIGGDSTHSALVNFSITGPTELTETPGTITVTVTLTEPTDQATYEAIKNQIVTFDLVFTIE